MNMATIKAIEARSIHQIQSGQVIVDLCSVVKELVENSLDAGATSIDIRFKNNGLDLIEVQDNGHGIPPNNYEGVALKHHTSKLSTFEDLSSLQTFGFRGEALSSLCALSDFHIVTAQANQAPKATRLDFEVSGKLKTLNTGVRFNVKNQMPKGKSVVVFATKSNPTTKENISNVYGAKTLLALIPLDLELEFEPSAESKTSRRQQDGLVNKIFVHGYISKPVFGEGRQTPDRQMFFVNSRPCGLPHIARAFNEVYRSFNISQSPFIFANFEMNTNAYDVNVSPDHPTLMLHDAGALILSLKTSLTELFEEEAIGVDKEVQESDHEFDEQRTSLSASPEPAPQGTGGTCSSTQTSVDVSELSAPPSTSQTQAQEPDRSSQVSPLPSQERNLISGHSTPQSSPNMIKSAFDRMRPTRPPAEIATITIGGKTTISTIGYASAHKRKAGQEGDYEEQVDLSDDDHAPEEDIEEEDGSTSYSDESYIDDQEKEARDEQKVAELIQAAEETANVPSENNLERAHKMSKRSRGRDSTVELMCSVDGSLAKIEAQLKLLQENLESLKNYKASEEPISEEASEQQDSAETRLSLTVSKDDFAKMRVVGQFNLGFILAIRPGTDSTDFQDNPTKDELFIIDQHASDEKYNFERLQAETVVQNQRLVRPKTLDLTAVEEEVIIDNIPTLEKNGFIVDIDTSGDEPIGRRCKLISLPLSKEVVFNTRDLEELIVLLSESPQHHRAPQGDGDVDPASSSSQFTNLYVPRPGKVRKMFAMRACRSSIMIGKSLTVKQMERVVRHMGMIDKPWNCPHGRPTMRHLMSLGRWNGWEEWPEIEITDDEEGHYDESEGWSACEQGSGVWKRFLEDYGTIDD
ncbi:DNA mismatch repair protein PMS1 [Coccidioides immitis H538.4]|uniref:DNA mismatch repair protein PMS1 n=1 Tax=Coccidioides immitis H538.4 TaxID=396776 RepID=A0A0J8RKP3_COCIT|nr:DNA mismatch repair protein PMS1 [Coccidioides immitis H538.4]